MFELNHNQRITDRKRVMELVGQEFGEEPDDLDSYEVPEIPQTSLPDDAAPSGAEEQAAPASPAAVEPPPAPPSYEHYQAEARELRALANDLIRQNREREEFYRQQAQQFQQQQQAPQVDPDQYLQHQHIAPHLQRMDHLQGGVQFVVNELVNIQKNEAKRELDSALSIFRAKADEYPDFDKYVKPEAVQQALVGVQTAIARGEKINPNWAQLIDQEYRQHSYDDLRAQVKARATEEAKRTAHAKKLADVGGTPRGGSYQQATPPPAKPGDSGSTRSRMIDFIKSFGS